MHCRWGCATLSQLAFARESNPNFQCKESQSDNTVVKNNNDNNDNNILCKKPREGPPCLAHKPNHSNRVKNWWIPNKTFNIVWWLFPHMRGFWGDCSIYFPPALFFFLKCRLACTNKFHSLGHDQSTVAQQAETTVTECSLMSCV